ncbi:MAG: hypothetical protein M3Y62_04495 [Candidatus Dormibacteraeota bacterium]|nr:hypothetical protein [Candidatus Dormibacteraeota bacterium]
MAEEICPSCGAVVPREAGQHAMSPSAGVVECPSCGAKVTLAKPGSRSEDEAAEPSPDAATTLGSRGGETGGDDYFSGEESLGGVMKEVEEKEGG